MMWYCSPQLLRHPVPVAAVVPAAVDKHQGRRIGVAPVHVVQLQALRIEDVRCWPDDSLDHVSPRPAGGVATIPVLRVVICVCTVSGS